MNTLVELQNTGSRITAPKPTSPGKIALRCQAPPDQQKLLALVPLDQQRTFTASWDNEDLVFIEVAKSKSASSDPAAESLELEITKLKSMNPKQLERVAVERGVEWDKSASIETMRERVAAKK